MADRLGFRRPVLVGCCAALAVALSVSVAPAVAADGCPPGHLSNPYTGQCYVVGSAPTINGVPCIASKLGPCSAFVQNQPPPKKPGSRIGS